jgi:hypothetical protein
MLQIQSNLQSQLGRLRVADEECIPLWRKVRVVEEVRSLLATRAARQTDATHDVAAKGAEDMIQPYDLVRTRELNQSIFHFQNYFLQHALQALDPVARKEGV